MNFISLFGIYFHCKPVLPGTQVSDIGPSWSSCLHSSISRYNQSAPNLVKMYVTIRSQSSIMDLIRAELSELFALEFAKIAESDFVYTLASTNVDQ